METPTKEQLKERIADLEDNLKNGEIVSSDEVLQQLANKQMKLELIQLKEQLKFLEAKE